MPESIVKGPLSGGGLPGLLSISAIGPFHDLTACWPKKGVGGSVPLAVVEREGLYIKGESLLFILLIMNTNARMNAKVKAPPPMTMPAITTPPSVLDPAAAEVELADWDWDGLVDAVALACPLNEGAVAIELAVGT